MSLVYQETFFSWTQEEQGGGADHDCVRNPREFLSKGPIKRFLESQEVGVYVCERERGGESVPLTPPSQHLLPS